MFLTIAQLPEKRCIKQSFKLKGINIDYFTIQLSWLSRLSRNIYEAGVDDEHFNDIRKAALESTKAAVRRLSIKCAQELASSRASKTFQKSKKTKSRRVFPEMRYMYRLGLDT